MSLLVASLILLANQAETHTSAPLIILNFCLQSSYYSGIILTNEFQCEFSQNHAELSELAKFLLSRSIVYSTYYLLNCHIGIPGNVKGASKTLRECYIHSRFIIRDNEWPPYQPKNYAALVVIHHKNEPTDTTMPSITKQLATKGKFISADDSRFDFQPNSEDLCRQSTKNIADLFVAKANESTSVPNIILIEGAPGIGKTVLSKEIAYLWASKKVLVSKQLLFLIALRCFDFKQTKSITAFVQHVLKSGDAETAAAITKHITQNSGADLVLVLDGYDEMAEDDRKYSFIADIIHRVVLPKCLLVITSRPTASLHFHNYVDCRVVEVVGFTEENRFDYIRTASPESYEDIKEYLESNPTINALCYVPLNMNILLCLAKKDINYLPRKQTEMYWKFIAMTVNHFLNQLGIHSITSPLDLPTNYRKLFNEISRFAFEGMKHDKLVFTLAELKQICPNLTGISTNWNGMGLLNCVKSYGPGEDVTYNFLHFSIQEYMAAYYISTLPDDQQIQLLKDKFWTIRYYNTWIMYSGITSKNNFVLKHFLSGNWFPFLSRLVRTSISSKFLSDKVKCLHMFQCLVEAEDNEMISLVESFFQGGIINLSNQTLLPKDLSTLAFFLVRSPTKKWKGLDLSKCNIGIDGCKILSKILSANDMHHTVRINSVDLSHNQLDFFSFVELFHLFKCWCTTEVFVEDALNNTSANKLWESIETAFVVCDSETALKTVSTGSFIFAYKSNDCFNISKHYDSMCLLNCTTSPEINLTTLLFQHKPVNIHILETHINRTTVGAIGDKLINGGEFGSLYIYDSTLPDEIADEIGSLIMTNNSGRIMLIISKTKVQGVINTCSLSSELSNLEILNLIIKIRSLRCNITSIISWNNNLHFCGDKSKAVIQCLTDTLFSNIALQIKLKVIEEDTFIANKVDINDNLLSNHSFKAIYLSACNLNDEEYQKIHGTELLFLYIVHSCLQIKLLCVLLSRNFFTVQEIFIHSSSTITDENITALLPCCKGNSIVIVAQDNLVVHNPTDKQLALALQVEPSINVWRCLKCKSAADSFNKIMEVLATANKCWNQLDFIECDLKMLESEVVGDWLNEFKPLSTVKKIKLSMCLINCFSKSTLLKIAAIWQIEQLHLSISDEEFYYGMVKNLVEILCSFFKEPNQLVLTISCGNLNTSFYYNVEWELISETLNSSITSLFIINCLLTDFKECEIGTTLRKLQNLSKFLVVNSSLKDRGVCNLLREFQSKKIEITIVDDAIPIEDDTLYSLVTDKDFYYNAKLHFVVVMDNFLCGNNLWINHLNLGKCKFIKYPFCEMEKIIITMPSAVKLKHMFVFENHELTAFYLVANRAVNATQFITAINSSNLKVFGIENCNTSKESIDHIHNILRCNSGIGKLYLNEAYISTEAQRDDGVKIARALQNILSLTEFDVGNNNITEEAADDIAAVLSHNANLKVLYLGGNNLQTGGVIKIAKALKNVSLLTKLNIGYNNITEGAADDIAAVLSCNSNLQVINLHGNNLRTQGIISIAKALQTFLSLTEIDFGDNNITEGAAKYIAVVLSHNTNLQVLCLCGNDLKTEGVIIIAKALQNTSSLTTLDIGNNNITKKAADYIAAVLSCNTNLQVLCLRGNDLQTEGAIKIAKALKKTSSLTTLDVGNNNITKKAANTIEAVLSRNTNLQVLSLCGNKLQRQGIIKIARALQSTSSLTTLDVGSNNMTEEAADDIAAVLLHNPNLQLVTLCENDLRTEGVIKIAKALQNISSLTTLDLGNNNITEDAADDIAAVLSCNPSLRVLDVRGNKLQTQGIIKMARALQSTTLLTTLDVSNSNITEEAAGDIAAVLSHNLSLKVLDVHGNKLQTKGVIKIARALQSTSLLTALDVSNVSISEEAADDIAAILSHNTNLQVLCLGKNNFQAEGVIKIARALQNFSLLTKLDVSCTNISEEVADDIAAILSHNTNLQVLNLHGNDLRTRGVIKITKVMQNVSSLTELDVGNNNISEEAADGIAAVLSYNCNLQVLCLCGNNLQTIGAIKIARGLQNTSSLSKLDLGNNNIAEGAANEIAAVLSHNANLQELCLEGNNLQPGGVAKIARALLTSLLTVSDATKSKEPADTAADILYNPQLLDVCLSKENDHIKLRRALQNVSSLNKLDLSYNNITKEAANNLAVVLSCNANLKVLCLCGNNLQTQGVIEIAKALQKVLSLVKLDLSFNNIREKAADDIAAVVSCNASLQALCLGGNNLQTGGVIKILSVLRSTSLLTTLDVGNNNITEEAADDIAAVLSHNTSLQVLNLHGNKLKTQSVIKIARALQNTSSLTTLDVGKANITEEAADDIAAVISHNTNLQVLCLGRNNFQAEGVIKIARALQNFSSLTKLDVSCTNITEEVADDIAAVLSHNANLQVLCLGRNDFQAKGVIKIARALQNFSSLTKLDVSYTSITEEEADNIATVLSHNTNLQVLNLHGNDLRTRGVITIAKVMQNVSSLTELDFGDNNISEEAADDIAAVLSSNTNLQVLCLCGNNLQTIGAIKIAKGLQNNSSLTILDVGNNNITKGAADDIAAVLSHNVNLQVLCLGENYLQTGGVIKIARALRNTSLLTTLDVSNNGITEKAAVNIAALLSHNTNLQVLNLHGNKLQTQGVIEIARNLQSTSLLTTLDVGNNSITEEAAYYIAAVISHNANLQKLDLRENDLRTGGVITIARALQNVSSLTELYIDNNNISEEGADTIAAILSHNTNLKMFGLHVTNK